jgi:hypothetical protein
VNDGGGTRQSLGAEAEGVGLQRQEFAVRAYDLVLVYGSLADFGDEDLPHSTQVLAHGVPASVPEVEPTDHGDAPRVRGPHREVRASDAFEHHRVRPEYFIEFEVVALPQEVEILVAENTRKAVRVLDLGYAAVLPHHPQAVRRALPNRPGEEALAVDDPQVADGVTVAGEDLDRARARQECPHQRAAFRRVHPEERKWIAVVACDDGGDRVFLPHGPSSRSRTLLIGMPTQSGRLSSS